jgi:hypothetical protein
VHLHNYLQILNKFCLYCYIQSDNLPSVHPRSTLLCNPHYELITLNLNDVSECPVDISLNDVSRGEAAVEGSTDSAQRDRTESVSDASQYVAGDSAMQNPYLSETSVASSSSTPSLDDESRNHTSLSPSPQASTISASMNGLMSSRLPSLTLSPRTHDADRSISVVVSQPPSNGKFTCPNCPRTFTGQAKARFALDFIGYLSRYPR